MTKVLGIREKVVRYRERAEKKYLSKMYKQKKYTSDVYERRKKDLERWVTKKMAEIYKAKAGMVNEWQITAKMIEEVRTRALKIKRVLVKNSFSDSSIALDESLEKIKVLEADSLIESTKKERRISIYDKGKKVNQPTLVTKQGFAEVVMEEIYNELIEDSIWSVIEVQRRVAECNIRNTLKQQATSKQIGISTDIHQVNKYIDELFNQIISSPNNLLDAINQPFYYDPLEILRHIREHRLIRLEANDCTCTMIPLSVYLKLEKAKAVNNLKDGNKYLLGECEHIHNKAIFDCINHALNFVRLYGIHGGTNDMVNIRKSVIY
jgi:hypothetical protein